jgi:hypothetical protein
MSTGTLLPFIFAKLIALAKLLSVFKSSLRDHQASHCFICSTKLVTGLSFPWPYYIPEPF